MTKPIFLSKDAMEVVNYLASKSLEDELFKRELDALLAKTDDAVKKGLAVCIKSEFPALVDQNLEEEVLKGLNQSGKEKLGSYN